MESEGVLFFCQASFFELFTSVTFSESGLGREQLRVILGAAKFRKASLTLV